MANPTTTESHPTPNKPTWDTIPLPRLSPEPEPSPRFGRRIQSRKIRRANPSPETASQTANTPSPASALPGSAPSTSPAELYPLLEALRSERALLEQSRTALEETLQSARVSIEELLTSRVPTELRESYAPMLEQHRHLASTTELLLEDIRSQASEMAAQLDQTHALQQQNSADIAKQLAETRQEVIQALQESAASATTQITSVGRQTSQALTESGVALAREMQTTRTETTAVLEEASSTLGGRMMWISAGSGALSALLLIGGLTLTRPGWTMSPTQREQIEVGRSAMHQYERADGKRRKEILKVMHWTVPTTPDSASATPRPKPMQDPES